MPFFKSPFDGAQLHYIDYVPASTPPTFGDTSTAKSLTLVFIHGWPMSSQMYESLILQLCENARFRCIAPDRRGFGKSEWSGTPTGDITYDVFAQDTVHLIELLKLDNFIFVASSMGCGETLLATPTLKGKCKGLVWLGPSLPFPLKTEANPDAPARELWDMILSGFRADRVGFVKASIGGVFGIPFNIGIELPDTVLARFENMVNQADALAIERCVQIITHRDFTPELQNLGALPLLVIHGDSDQSMPASASASLIPQHVKHAEVKIYEKAAHGLYLTHEKEVMQDVLAFVSGL